MENREEIRLEIKNLFAYLRMIRRERNWQETHDEQHEILNQIKGLWTDLASLEGSETAHMHVEALRYKYL